MKVIKITWEAPIKKSVDVMPLSSLFNPIPAKITKP